MLDNKFVNKLTKEQVEKLVPPFCQLKLFIQNKEQVYIRYIDLINNDDVKIELYDFDIHYNRLIENISKNIIDKHIDYLKFMYEIFGEEYKQAYLDYINNTVFNK